MTSSHPVYKLVPNYQGFEVKNTRTSEVVTKIGPEGVQAPTVRAHVMNATTMNIADIPYDNTFHWRPEMKLPAVAAPIVANSANVKIRSFGDPYLFTTFATYFDTGTQEDMVLDTTLGGFEHFGHDLFTVTDGGLIMLAMDGILNYKGSVNYDAADLAFTYGIAPASGDINTTDPLAHIFYPIVLGGAPFPNTMVGGAAYAEVGCNGVHVPFVGGGAHIYANAFPSKHAGWSAAGKITLQATLRCVFFKPANRNGLYGATE